MNDKSKYCIYIFTAASHFTS